MRIKRKKIQVFIDVTTDDDGDVPEIICRALTDIVTEARGGAKIDWPSLLIHSDGGSRVSVVTDTHSTEEEKTLRLTVDIVTEVKK